MKKHLLQLSLIVLGTFLLHPASVLAQNPNDAGNAIANIIAIGEAAKAAKLQRQNEALKKIKDTFDGLQNGGSAQEALNNSVLAIQAYPKFSTPYLLAAYASLQLDDALNAHRFLILYDRARNNPESREINKDVPQTFVQQIRTQTSTRYSKFSTADIERLSAHDGWKNQSVDLDIDIALRAVFSGDTDFGENAAEIDVEPQIALGYHKYFWFTKGNAFSTSGPKNIGIDLNAGVAAKMNILNAGFFPNRAQLFFQPGIFLGRWYIAPFRVQLNKMAKYSDDAVSFPYNYSQGGSVQHTSYDPQSAMPFLPFPEIRYYTHFLSGFAFNHKKNSKPALDGPDETYIYVKWNDEIYSGAKNDQKITYGGEQADGILGFQFDGGGKASIGMYIGFGSATVKKFDQKGTVYTPASLLDDMYFKSGIKLKFKLY